MLHEIFWVWFQWLKWIPSAKAN
uniref:Uncharacterized protein n=1 Tax=Arundo donax TaxID=35708 RepID=A0A0A9BRE1_ARUDO